MADPSIHYFRLDDSAQGTVKVNGPPTSATDPTPIKVFTIQCYVAVRLTSSGTASTVVTDVGPFVKCVHRNTFAFFVKLEDFQTRVGAADYATLLATYQKDWAVGGDAPAFPGWGEDGQPLVTWPAQGIIAKESSKDRYADQRTIWVDVAQHAENAGSRARLWEPKEPLNPRWKIYFVPGGAWLSPQALQHILDRLAAQEKARNQYMNLTSWLDFSAISQEEATTRAANNEILPVSTNLFGHYTTYTTVGDVKAMIAAQTEKRNRNCHDAWLRVFPEEQAVLALEEKLKDHRSLLTLTKTALKASVSSSGRADLPSGDDIMGESANDWARSTLWPGEDIKDVGSWLRRSDPKFGPLLNGDWQSSNNLFFGTHETRSNLDQAVSLIRSVLNKTNAAFGKGWQGSLITRAVRKGNIDYMNSSGLASVFPIPPWINDSKSAWVVPSLLYTGSFQIPTDLPTPFAGPPLVWDTQYSAFSCYTPLSIEGKLDHLILDIYLAKHFGIKPWHGVQHPNTPKATITAVDLPGVATLPATAFNVQSSVAAQGSAVQALNGASSAGSSGVDPSQVQQGSPSRNYGRLGQVMKHPIHQLAWQAGSQGRQEVNLGGVSIKEPRIAQKDPKASDSPASDSTSSTPPSDGFVLTGSIDLFGLGKSVQLMSWHGPPPAHVVFGKELPTYQHVEVDTLFASQLLPLLAGTPFNSFQFRNVVITYQNYAFEPTKPLGWSMTADLSLGPEHGSVYHVLKDVLQVPVDSLQLRVSSSLGLGYSWAKQPVIPTLFIEGVLNLPNPLTLCKGVILSRVGIRLSAIQTMTAGIGGKPVTKCGYSLFGDMHVDVPSSKQPVEFDFVIHEVEGDVELNASLKSDKWENAFGSGIDLETASLSLLLDASKHKDAWSFYLQAELSTGDSVTHLTGYYSVGGRYDFQATIKNFGVDGLLKFCAHHFTSQGALSPPTHLDFSIGSATISINSDKGLEISVDSLRFEGYTADSAEIHVSSSGVTIEGAIAEVKFPEVDIVSLKDASIRVSFEKTDSGRSSDIVLAGDLEVEDLHSARISAVVHLYKAAGAEKLEWTIYGQFEELGDSTSLGVLFDELKDSFLKDIAIQGLTLIVASKDDPAASSMNPQNYTIKQGVQICATVGEVSPFRKLLRRPTPGLILNAGYSKPRKFSLAISVPEDTMIHLGRGITTDPITLSISTAPVQLEISAGLKVPVPHSTDPLDFKATLAIVDEDISVSGEMQGLWKDPFGIGESVSIGPDLALQIGIILPTFFVTGLPGEFAFTGGLSIGSVDGQVEFQVSEDPTQELLGGSIEKLSILDVVAFLRRVTGLDIHDPSDFLDFLKVQLYMSTGATIGTVSYPAGFSFEADILLFGTKLHAGAAITNSSLLVKGSVGELPVGPLKIKGSGTNGVAMDLEVGSAATKMTIDGMFDVLGADVAILLDLELLPKPVFKFDFALQFTDLLVFNVDATMLGVADLKDLSHLDFELHALFEQHMLSYLRDQLARMVESCKLKEQEDIDAAKKKVEEEKGKLTSAIDAAQRDLDAKHNTWTTHQDEVNTASGAVVAKYQASLKRLQDAVGVEQTKFDLALKSAQNAVQHANADRADKMRQAEAAVTNAKNAWDADVAQKEKELEDKKAAFSQRFGNAEKDIENAKAKVDSIQNDINGVQGKINDYSHAKWTEFWKKAAIPELYVALGTLKASKGVADGVLNACEAVVRGVDYAAVKGAIPLAEDALAAAGKVGNAAFNDATEAVKAADRISGEAVTLAEKALDGVQKGGDAALRGAQATLDQFIQAQKAILDAAQKAIDDLVKGVEWLAYQAASAALDVAKHSTAALDVATRALDLVEQGGLQLLTLGEEALEKLMSTLDIQKLELDGTLNGLLGESGKHFKVSVEGLFANKPFKYDDVELNLKDITQFAHDIFVRLDKLI